MAKMGTVNTRKALNNFMNKNKGKDNVDAIREDETTVTNETPSSDNTPNETSKVTTRLEFGEKENIEDLRDELKSIASENNTENNKRSQEDERPTIPNLESKATVRPNTYEEPNPIVTTKTVLREQRKRDESRGYTTQPAYNQHDVKHSNDVRIINIPTDSNVQALQIDTIRDEEGYICARVNRIEDETGIAVLPFNKIGLLPQVEYIQGHEMVFIYGDKYVTSVTRIINESALYQYVSKIEKCIVSGVEFDETLIIASDFKGERITTLRFNIKELAFIKAKFQQLPCTVYETSSGDMRLNVGGLYV